MAKNKKTKRQKQASTRRSFIGFLKTVPLVLICYIAVLAVWLVVSSFGFVQDSIMRGTGSLKTQTLTAEDFTHYEMEPQSSGAYKTTSDDPQMHLEISGGIRTLRYYAAYENSSNPLEICLYYTRNVNEPFSETMRVWPALQDDGSRIFTLPRGNIAKIRLDPASALTHITFGEIVLNEPQSFVSYYYPGWGRFVAFLVLPGVLAAALSWLILIFKRFFPQFFPAAKADKKNPKFKQPVKRF